MSVVNLDVTQSVNLNQEWKNIEEETLVASLRPIIITAKQQSIPSNFTVLSAAKGNQNFLLIKKCEIKLETFCAFTLTTSQTKPNLLV